MKMIENPFVSWKARFMARILCYRRVTGLSNSLRTTPVSRKFG